MTIRVRELDYDDYETLCDWWKDWGFSPPSRDFLPDDAMGGVMISCDDTPVCAGFIYETNSRSAWVEWIISNKKFRLKPYRSLCLDTLIEVLTDKCHKKGYKYVYSNNNNSFLIGRFIKHGYNIGAVNATELLKVWV